MTSISPYQPGVLVEATGRMDIVIRRGVTEKYGVQWEHSDDGGLTFAGVDISLWTGVFVLRSPVDEELLRLNTKQSSSGLSQVEIRPTDLSKITIAGRTAGNWYLNITDPATGRTERLGDGYFYLEN